MKMKKAAGLLVLTFCVLAVGAGAHGASNKCRVVEASEKKLVLECERDTSQFQAGDQVKLKSVRTNAAVEGC